jgi:hypothetical protein
LTGAAGALGSGLGIASGIQQGGVQGDARAAAGAGNFLGKVTGNTGLNMGATGLNDVLGLYSGIKQGGVGGYGQALGSGTQLAGLASGNPALSAIGGDIMAPLALYNFGKNWQSGATGQDALGGAEAGASIGSIVPGIGTLLGGLIGGGVGALSSAFGGGKHDPETDALYKYLPQYNKDPSIAQNMSPANNFQELAGVFDAKNNTPGHSTPLEQQYGRMGEGAFLNDITGQINQAVQSGKINPNASASDIYSQVVNPYLSGKGMGIQSNWTDAHGQQFGNALQDAVTGLIGQWQSGQINNQTPLGVKGQADSGLQAYAGSNMAPKYNMQALQGLLQQNPNMNVTYRRGGPVHFDDGGYADPSYSDMPEVDVIGSMNSVGMDPTLANWGQNNDPVFTGQLLDPSTYATPDMPMPGGFNFDSSGGGNGAGGGGGGGSSSGGGFGSALMGGLNSLLSHPSALAALLGGGLSALGAAQNNGQNMTQQYHPAPPPMFGNSGTMHINSAPRQQNNMAGTNWNTLGQGPMPSFFGPQQAQQAQPAQLQAAPAQGGSSIPLAQLIQMLQGGGGQRAVMADGGRSPLAESMGPGPEQGSRHVKGPGDGTSDDIPARLSSGEYVIDAGSVSMLGNGDNDAGAARLDELRKNLRMDAGKKLVKGKQFMKAKAPHSYMGSKK